MQRFTLRPALVLAALAGGTAVPLVSQEAPSPARGLTVWVRAGGGSAAELAGSAVAAPQLAIGSRSGSITLGIGLGVSRVSASDESQYNATDRSTEDLTATLFQVGPEALIDVWRSADGRTRGNVSAGVAYGRVKATDRTVDVFGGSTNTSESSTSGAMYTVRLGIGGEHWLHPNFALGFEAGLRFTAASDLKEEGTATTSGFGAAGSYAALRAQVVFGR